HCGIEVTTARDSTGKKSPFHPAGTYAAHHSARPGQAGLFFHTDGLPTVTGVTAGGRRRI
ncbi:MAG: hypothetical protein PVH54_11385, partial [Gammaproteobacteria bacterium]